MAWLWFVDPTVALATSILAITFAQLVWRVGEDLIKRKPIIRCSMTVNIDRVEGPPTEIIFSLQRSLKLFVKNVGEGTALEINIQGLPITPSILPGLRPGEEKILTIPSPYLDLEAKVPPEGNLKIDCKDAGEKNHSFKFKYEIHPETAPLPLAIVQNC